MIRNLAVVAAMVLGLCTVTASRAAPPPDTGEGILSFAGALLRSGDSFRAATEYLRFLHHHPDEPGHLDALEGLGRAYSLANRHDDAARVFRQLVAAGGDDPDRARWLLGSALYQGRHFADAATVLLGTPDGETGEASAVLGTLALLRDDPETPLPPAARGDLATGYRALPTKSPPLAGTLSAVLPGAGHFYCGRPRDGTVSFLLNAAFLWGVYESVQRENWPVAGILGFFELGWYSGNIVSSMNAAHKWNRREQGRFLREWEGVALPQWQLAIDKRGIGGALSWRW